jgi:putative PIN family toxin of toxin-antitoxin system
MKGIDRLIFNGKAVLLFSDESMTEFIDVTSRSKLKSYFIKDDLASLIDLMEEYGEIIEVKSKVNVCRDKEDNFLLSLAKDGKADYLITGDKDLLVLDNFGKTEIIKLADFLEKYR